MSFSHTNHKLYTGILPIYYGMLVNLIGLFLNQLFIFNLDRIPILNLAINYVVIPHYSFKEIHFLGKQV